MLPTFEIPDNQAPIPRKQEDDMNDMELARPTQATTPRLLHRAVGTLIVWRAAVHRDQRGLSQSTENAVLLTGAVAIALTVIGLVGNYVATKLGELG